MKLQTKYSTLLTGGVSLEKDSVKVLTPPGLTVCYVSILGGPTDMYVVVPSFDRTLLGQTAGSPVISWAKNDIRKS